MAKKKRKNFKSPEWLLLNSRAGKIAAIWPGLAGPSKHTPKRATKLAFVRRVKRGKLKVADDDANPNQLSRRTLNSLAAGADDVPILHFTEFISRCGPRIPQHFPIPSARYHKFLLSFALVIVNLFCIRYFLFERET